MSISPRWFIPGILLLGAATVGSGQLHNAPKTTVDTPDEMQLLLTETAKSYREARSFNIQRRLDAKARSDMSESWSKSFSSVAAAPGNRYRREDKSDYSWEIRQSDGANEWQWDPWRKQYAEVRVNDSVDAAPSPADTGWVGWLKQIDKKLAAGKLQPAETIEIDGRKVNCMVVVGPPPAKEWPDPTMKQQSTYWIDRDRKVVVREQLTIISTVPEHKFEFANTTSYTTVELNPTLPDSLFTFTPPNGAERIPRFEFGSVVLVGKPAPQLRLKTLDGKDFDLTSLLGRPVLIDFWATWCVPCRQSMPAVAKIYEEFHSKGLEVVGVNIGDDPEVVTRFVRKNNLSSTHLEDPDIVTEQHWGQAGIPRLVLIGKDGKVLFDSDGWDENEEKKLRSALHAIDPSFSSPESSKK
jgi:thiol-disulfide isomerase/thioredoxin